MRVRKVLPLTLAIILVLGTFTFGFGVTNWIHVKVDNANEVIVEFINDDTMQLTQQGNSNLWIGEDNKEYVTDDIVAFIVDGYRYAPASDYAKTEGGGTINYGLDEPPTGTITIRKNVTNVDDDTTYFQFTGGGGPDYYSINTQVSETNEIVRQNRYYGDYTFTEVVTEGYTGVVTEVSVTLDENNTDVIVEFENTLNEIYDMEISKTVVTDRPYYPGEEINYEITVTNTGNQTLTDIDVTDEMIGLDETILSLAPGATSDVFTGSYTAGADELGTLTNTATASSGDLSVESSVDVTIIDEDTEMYSVSLEVEPEGSGTTTGAGDYYEDQTVTVTAAPNTGWEFVNWVSLAGEEPEEVSTDSSYTFTMPASNVALVANFREKPDEDTFSITVHKDLTGTATDTEFEVALVTDEIYQDLIEEPNDGFNGPPPEGTPTGVISEGNPHTFTNLEPGVYWILENPNEGGFYFQQDKRVEIQDQDEEVTMYNYQYPTLGIEKTVDDTAVRVNEDVTYTITVTNLGGFYLPEVELTDEQLDFLDTFELAVGESQTREITTSYSTTGLKENTAIAKSEVYIVEGEGLYSVDPDDMEYDEQYYIVGEFILEVEDSAEVDVSRRPSRTNTYRMTIDKEADGNFYEVGDTIEYTITVENTGNTTLTNIEVVDEMTGLEETIDSLSPGETEEFETSYVAQQEDVGTLTNTATAEDDRAGTEEASVDVEVEDVPEGVPGTYEITIEKTAIVEGDILMGDMVEFMIVVTNTGDETIENILVEDKMVKFEAVIDELEPGESKEFTVNLEAKKPGPLENIATATSTETGTVEDGDIVYVDEPTPKDVPDTGVAPTDLLFGLGALVSGLGVFFTKKRK